MLHRNFYSICELYGKKYQCFEEKTFVLSVKLMVEGKKIKIACESQKYSVIWLPIQSFGNGVLEFCFVLMNKLLTWILLNKRFAKKFLCLSYNTCKIIRGTLFSNVHTYNFPFLLYI